MIQHDVLKQDQELLRGIVRSIDKKLDYSFIDPAYEGKFALRLSTRGREGTVSLSTEDLKSAQTDAVRKNAIRQKIKSTRDYLLSNYVVDVMGKKVAKMLKQSGGAEDESRGSYFRRPPRTRR